MYIHICLNLILLKLFTLTPANVSRNVYKPTVLKVLHWLPSLSVYIWNFLDYRHNCSWYVQFRNIKRRRIVTKGFFKKRKNPLWKSIFFSLYLRRIKCSLLHFNRNGSFCNDNAIIHICWINYVTFSGYSNMNTEWLCSCRNNSTVYCTLRDCAIVEIIAQSIVHWGTVRL